MDVSHLDPRLQIKAKEFSQICSANGFDLNVVYMSKDEAIFVLDIMGNYWYRMQGNEEVQNEVHRIANILRRTFGIPEE